MSLNRELNSEKTLSYQDHDDRSELKEHSFELGKPLTFIRVRFPGNAKSFPFLIGQRRFAYGQKVVAMSDRGMDVGYINSFPYTVPFEESMLPINTISKAATEEDLQKQRDFIEREKQYERICLSLIEKYRLDMVLTHVELIQFGKKIVFYFNAPARVDFRDLVKDLVSELKMRIELRQISVRDRTAALGAIGVCGLQTCCSSFLKNYGNVNIRMAKNQNLALIPIRLNGVCGELKCCVKYEDQVYTHKRQFLPLEGAFIQAKNGDRGKILRLHILEEQFEMLTDKGHKRLYHVEQYNDALKIPEDWSFPGYFENIINETSKTIGEAKKNIDRAESPEDIHPYPVLDEVTDKKTEPIKEDPGQQPAKENILIESPKENIVVESPKEEIVQKKEDTKEIKEKKKKLGKFQRRSQRLQQKNKKSKKRKKT